ncbi:PAS domain protein [Candidatus Bilamarchaeum dharawalense]|uniref:histidine kinase n=1 Tax=Candidatus Bilamarchaeum dharawalense TaxID=2885759 RepID=A0A5E4LKK5_9ARCH|nr:PAS domain protein [Candidatus Bilamarchaeum dharawalense]
MDMRTNAVYYGEPMKLHNKTDRKNNFLIQDKLRYMLADSPFDWIYWIDTNRKLSYMSESCKRITGYARDAFFKNPKLLSTLTHPVDRRLMSDHMKKCLKNKEVAVIRYRILDRNGREHLIEHLCHKVYDIEGNWIGRRISNRDITEVMKLNKAVIEATEKASLYLDIASSMIVVIKKDQTIDTINKKACDILGYPQRWLMGKNWFDLCIPKSDRKKVKAVFKRIIHGKLEPVKSFENLIQTRDGEQKRIAWNNSYVRDSDGDIIATISSGQDITEQSRMEQLRKASLQNKTAIINYINDAIIVFDKKGMIVDINPAFERVTGYNRSELIDKNIFDIASRVIKSSQIKACARNFTSALLGKPVDTSETTIISKAGLEIPVLYTFSYIHDENLGLVITSMVDISQYKKSRK